MLELRNRDSGGCRSNSYPNPTNYHVIENIVHISKGDKFSILVLAITIDTDNPVNFYIFDIKEKQEINTGVINNSNSRKLLYNKIKKIECTPDDDLSLVQINIKETVLTT